MSEQAGKQEGTTGYLTAVIAILILAARWIILSKTSPSKCPISVNYHFTRQCNKSCGFCFHTATTSHKENLDQAKKGLKLLKEAGMRKLNFAGGEPFLYAKHLGDMIDYCKEELHLESVSIVTNGSKVARSFFEKHGHNIDILAVSCDSFSEQTNIEIGRGDGNQFNQLYKIAGWCREFGIKFKLNTVVCRLNFMEDMNDRVAELQPFRWKCFQVLMVQGENDSADKLRDVRKFMISDEDFEAFCLRHQQQRSLVPESNVMMAKSYLILDEYMRFLDRDGRTPSPSILEVGVDKALSCVFWDDETFVKRGGLYSWTRDVKVLVSCSDGKGLEW